MNNITKAFTCAAVGMLAVMIAPEARADAWNQKTVITFSGPVEIPGQVLQPGTYVFKLMNSMSDRNVVQVFNKDQTICYGNFLAVPDYRLKPTGKPIIRFEERAAGAPEAVKAWFYPGDLYGHEFVYPRARAQELARTNHEPVASMPDDMAAETTRPAPTVNAPPVVALSQAPLEAQQDNDQQMEIAQAFPPAPATPDQQADRNTDQLPQRLPQTGSELPLIALLGLASLGSAVLLRRVHAN